MSELPAAWAEATLAQLGDEVRGSIAPVPGQAYELYSVPTFPTGRPEVLDGSEIGSAKRPVQPGDVLLCKINPRINRVWMVAPPVEPSLDQIASTEYLVLRSRNPDLGRYLMWYLRSPRFRDWITLSVEGATGSHTRAKSGPILRQSVPVPPLNEQRRIVAGIEEQMSRLDAAEASLWQARARVHVLREAVLGHLLVGDWIPTTLGELANLITKGTTPTSIGYGFSDQGVLFVKAESLVRGLIDHARCAHIDTRTHEALARSRLAEDDIVVTIAGTLGRVGRVRGVDLPANTNQAVSLIRLKDRTLAAWVLTWLHGPVAQEYLRTAGRGVGLQNLNLKQVAGTPVRVPPLEERDRIVAEVDRQLSIADATATRIDGTLQRSAVLRRSVFEQAFLGKLVPSDPSDAPASRLVERIRTDREAAPKTSLRSRVRA